MFTNCEKRLLTSSIQIWYLSIFLKPVDKIQVSLKSDKTISTSYEDILTFMIISRSVSLKITDVSNESCGGNQNTFNV